METKVEDVVVNIQNDDEIEVDVSLEGYIGTYWELPEGLRENKYIHGGYRIGFQSFWLGLKTLFMWHNETVNVWTHFLGKIVFLGIVIWLFFSTAQMDQVGQATIDQYRNSGLTLREFTMQQSKYLQQQ